MRIPKSTALILETYSLNDAARLLDVSRAYVCLWKRVLGMTRKHKDRIPIPPNAARAISSMSAGAAARKFGVNKDLIRIWARILKVKGGGCKARWNRLRVQREKRVNRLAGQLVRLQSMEKVGCINGISRERVRQILEGHVKLVWAIV